MKKVTKASTRSFSRNLDLSGLALAGMLLGSLAAAPQSAAQAPRLNTGSFAWPVTTTSAKAQRFFNQGMAMCYGFNHAEAIRSFEATAKLDPDCAMAYWGVAYAYGPNINAPMTPDAAPKAWAALQSARRLAPKASAREQAYIEALAQRYRPEPPEDRSALDTAFAEAMSRLARDYPEDPNAAVLHAEAIMDTMPWDYWTADKSPKPATEQALASLERAMSLDVNHPGAHHFYIHAVEAGPHPEAGVPSAEALGKLVPDSGHLVHMPSHIFLRVGRYADAARANEKAVRVDEGYIAQCRAQGFYPGVYYPHNVHFLWYTYSMLGQQKKCVAEARKVARYALDNVCGPTPVLEAPRFRHLPLLAMARFGLWDQILAEPPPTGGAAFDQAMWHYARGLAKIGQQDADGAAKELEAFQRVATSEEGQKVDSPIFPGTPMLKLAGHLLTGRWESLRGNVAPMREAFEAALQAEAEIPYMEPPFWYYSARLSYGAALLRAGRIVEATSMFEQELAGHPNDPWGLYALSLTQDDSAPRAKARELNRRLKDAWKHADVRPDLSWY